MRLFLVSECFFSFSAAQPFLITALVQLSQTNNMMPNQSGALADFLLDFAGVPYVVSEALCISS